MKKGSPFIVSVVLVLLVSCIETSSRSNGADSTKAVSNLLAPPGQVISLLGTVLPPREYPERIREKREEELDVARKRFEAFPDSIELIIWYGRRLGYLGEYQEAIRIFTIGVDKAPNNYHLLRHRGHRYLTIRELDKAIDDLQKAAFYSRPAKNAIEPDGLPNRLNKPLTNDKFNIWYHLGIAYYVKGNYDKAISAFKQCMEFADNDDLKVATTDWFYMTYRKIGNESAANELLRPIMRRMTIIENQVYHERLMVYKGIYDPVALLDNANRENGSLDPNLAYGVGNWYLYNGDVEKAKAVYERILLNPAWDQFGFIATEADMRALNRL